MNKTPATAAKNAARCYNTLTFRADNGRGFCPLAWTHTAIRCELAAKTANKLMATDLRTMAADCRRRADVARTAGWLV